MHENDNLSASDLPDKLAYHAACALLRAGLHQVTQRSESEIKQLHGIAPNPLAVLRQAPADQGLRFAEQAANIKQQG